MFESCLILFVLLRMRGGPRYLRAADDRGVALHDPPLPPRLPHLCRQSRPGE